MIRAVSVEQVFAPEEKAAEAHDPAAQPGILIRTLGGAQAPAPGPRFRPVEVGLRPHSSCRVARGPGGLFPPLVVLSRTPCSTGRAYHARRLAL